MKNPWSIIRGVFLGLMFTGLVVLVVYIFVPEYRNIQKLRKRKSELQEKNRQMELRIHDIHRRRELFQSDKEFIERVAREQGMVHEDEVVFKFETENSQEAAKQ